MKLTKVSYSGVRPMNEFNRCLEQGRIVKIQPEKEMIDKEIESARYDLQSAQESLLKEDAKWASVQAYYSMFHSAKALVLKKGYREKSHYCLIIALRELYVKTGELEKEFVDDIETCMDVRHEADYGLVYDDESASICIKAAEKLILAASKLLDVNV